MGGWVRWTALGILIGTALAGGPREARAQVREEPGLSLEQAQEEALRSNPGLLRVAAEADAARARSRVPRARRRPRLEFESAYSRTTQPAQVFSQLLGQEAFGPGNFDIQRLNHPDPLNDFQTALVLQAPLWQGGALRREADAARASADGAQAVAERFRRRLRHEVFRAYVDAVAAASALEAARRTVATAEAHLQLAEDLLEAGMVVRADVLAARARLAQARASEAEALARRRIARAELNRLIGRPAVEDVPLVTTLDALREQLQDEPQVSGPGERADLRALARFAESARLRTEALGRSRWPTLMFQGRVETHGEDPFTADGDNWTTMLAFRWTLADSGLRAARLEAARASARAAEAAEREGRGIAETEQLAARARVEAARASRELALEALEAAEQALVLVRDRYQEGLVPYAELLSAETSLERARHQRVQADRAVLVALHQRRLADGRL